MARRQTEQDGRPLGSLERKSRSGTPWKPRKRVVVVRVRRPGLRELPKRIVAQLGKMSDRALAEKAGVHPNTIHHERRRRGISAFQPISEPVVWTSAMIRLLGTATDRDVAAELGVGYSAVGRKRRLLGIPPSTPRQARTIRGHQWTSEQLGMLGKVSDRALARELGLATGTVCDQRTKLGIPPWRPRPANVKWTKAMLRLLGRLPDQEIARRFGISGSSVIQKRRRLGLPPVMDRRAIEHSPELLETLKLSKSEARRRTGLNFKTIGVLREKYGIRGVRASELRYRPEIVRRMGKEPDEVLAAELGVSSSAVRAKRASLGIPAYQGWRRRKRGPRRRAARRPKQ